MKNISNIIILCFAFLSALFAFLAWHSSRATVVSKENYNDNSILLPYYFQENLGESVIYNDTQIREAALKKIMNATEGRTDPILICWFSSHSCSSCVEYNESKLKEHLEGTDRHSIIFIESGGKKISEPSIGRHIIISKNDLSLPIENSNIPFFFILYENRIQHLFIPELTFPEYTDIYLRNIKKRYFSK